MHSIEDRVIAKIYGNGNGRDRFDEKSISQFRRAVKNEDCSKILKDAQGVADWIYEIIRKICSDNGNG